LLVPQPRAVLAVVTGCLPRDARSVTYLGPPGHPEPPRDAIGRCSATVPWRPPFPWATRALRSPPLETCSACRSTRPGPTPWCPMPEEPWCAPPVSMTFSLSPSRSPDGECPT